MFNSLYKIQWSVFFLNPIFLSAITSWLISQAIKTVFELFTSSIHSFTEFIELILWRTGGMPSSHSALVASLTVSIGFKEGFGSSIFIFSVFIAVVVIRDAVGVRRSSGLQARALNDLCTEYYTRNGSSSFKPLREIQGHRPTEAFAGIILGIITAIFFSYPG